MLTLTLTLTLTLALALTLTLTLTRRELRASVMRIILGTDMAFHFAKVPIVYLAFCSTQISPLDGFHTWLG